MRHFRQGIGQNWSVRLPECPLACRRPLIALYLRGGIFAIEVHHVLAEEDVVVVLATVKAERNGLSPQYSRRCMSGGLRIQKSLSSANSKGTSRQRIASGRRGRCEAMRA
jgi:hypothetical protein